MQPYVDLHLLIVAQFFEQLPFSHPLMLQSVLYMHSSLLLSRMASISLRSLPGHLGVRRLI